MEDNFNKILKELGIFTNQEVSNSEIISSLIKDSELIGMLKASFIEEHNNGNSSTAKTIDWKKGNKQKITTTGNCTLTFSNPFGPCNLLLKIVHEASATAYTYTWPANVYFPGGTDPDTTDTSGAVDIVALYFDGTNYYAQASLNFS